MRSVMGGKHLTVGHGEGSVRLWCCLSSKSHECLIRMADPDRRHPWHCDLHPPRQAVCEQEVMFSHQALLFSSRETEVREAG